MDKQVGKYKIVREIGKGGMGIVYKGLDAVSQRSVAIKILPAANVDRLTVQRFSREAQAMARLKHPNLIEIYDYGMAEGEHYLAMEYIDGDSLKNLLKHKGKLSVSECLEISTQTADALTCIHAEGMIHRDIKPGNIMITSQGKIKLMDLGLVQIPGLTRVTTNGSAVGTAEYMSPEQIADEGVDTRTDIYSLGVTMYEMLAGQPPFQGETVQAVLMKQKNETPINIRTLCPDVPPELGIIIAKAMAKELGQRYQRVQELLADLHRLKERSANPFRTTDQGMAQDLEPVVEASLANAVSAKPKRPRNNKILPRILVGIILTLLVYSGYYYRPELMPYVKKMKKAFGMNTPAQKKVPGAIRKVSKPDGIGLTIQEISDGIKKGITLPSETAKPADKTADILARLETAEKYHKRGQVFFQQGDWDAAIAQYQLAIQHRKDYGACYKDLAIAYEKKGEQAKEISAWKDLLKYAPASTSADMAREKIAELE